MNNYKDIMEDLDNKSDIATDEELLLFSETEEEEEEIEKKKASALKLNASNT
jgi:hypothetical protein